MDRYWTLVLIFTVISKKMFHRNCQRLDLNPWTSGTEIDHSANCVQPLPSYKLWAPD